MKPFKRIPIFLTLCLALIVGITTTQAQFNTGASTKLVLIDSFNDFASVQPANNTKSVIVVRYGTTEGDQQGGTFMYDSTSAASADGLNVFVPPSGVGRFLRFDNAVFLSKTATASRVMVTDGSGNVGTDADITFDGSNLTVTGNMTVGGLATGSTDDVVIRNGSDLLQYRQINPDVWNLAGDLDNSGEATSAATKIISPTISFDGSNDYIAVADSDTLSFQTESGTQSGVWSAASNTPFLTDGTGTLDDYYIVTAAGSQNLGSGSITYAIGDTVKYDGSVWYKSDKDDLPFTVAAWVKMSDATSFPIVGKYGASNATREWLFHTTMSDKIELAVQDINAAYQAMVSDAALTSSESVWTHVAATYDGSGVAAGITLYVNGAAVASTSATSGSYAGMADTSQAVWIGRRDSAYAEGEIRNVQIFNRELSASDIGLILHSDLGFADEWGNQTTNLVVDGDMEDSGTTDWTSNTVTLSKPTVDPQQAVRNIKATLNGGVTGYFETAATTVQANKRYRAQFYYRTGGTSPTAYSFRVNGGSWQVVSTLSEQASWTYHEVEFVINSDTTGDIAFHINSGTDASTFIEVDNFDVFSIGTLADFRAEQYDETTGKLYDISSNAFVGVNSGASLVGRSVPVFEVGTWTPTVTFGGGSTGITYTTQEGHYTREGNWVSVHAYIVLSNKGSDTGTALIAGLPFTARNTTASSQSLTAGNMANAANLTSAVTAYATDNGTTINLVDWGATGSAVLDDTNFGNTTSISITGKYQIQ